MKIKRFDLILSQRENYMAERADGDYVLFDEAFPDDRTKEDLVALDEIPCDAVSHWLAGEHFDFETKQWVVSNAIPMSPVSSRDNSESCETVNIKLLRAIFGNGETYGD